MRGAACHRHRRRVLLTMLSSAAVDMDDPKAIVSPGGVGFDINCGVRLIRTNLTEEDVLPVKEQLTQALFDHIPVGVGSKGIIPTSGAGEQQPCRPVTRRTAVCVARWALAAASSSPARPPASSCRPGGGP